MAIDRGDRGKCSIVEECTSGFFFSYSDHNLGVPFEEGQARSSEKEMQGLDFEVCLQYS